MALEAPCPPCSSQAYQILLVLMDRKGSWKMTAGQVSSQPMYKSIIKENLSINLGE
jgi:hypothetical protein